MNKKIAICVAYLEDVVKSLSRLARRAEKSGIPFAYTVGEEYQTSIEIWDYQDYVLYPTGQHITVDAVDITINMDNLVCNDGWSVIAQIDRLPDTDLRAVQTFGNTEIKTEWEHADMHCDHCHTNHQRNTVYIVTSPDGEERMVGKACLRDYTGIDPASLISWARVRDIMPSLDCLTADDLEDRIPAEYRYRDLDEILALAVDSISTRGYIKSSEGEDSTKADVLRRLGHHPSDEALKRAETIRQWLLTEEGQQAIDFMQIGSKAILESGCVKPAYIGYICYWPMAYQKYLDKLEEQKRRVGQNASSGSYVGEIGQRITLDVVNSRVISSWETGFGITYLWGMQDSDGNAIIWKTAKSDLKEIAKITGTVKAHTEYKGLCQTELTRCRVSA